MMAVPGMLTANSLGQEGFYERCYKTCKNIMDKYVQKKIIPNKKTLHF